MLQRLFSRNAPEDRVSDALEHSKALEERDALRERSAVILGRLERRQEQSRRAEIAARQSAREAAERAAHEAEAAAAAAQAEEDARAAAYAPVEDYDVAEADEVPIAYDAPGDDMPETAHRPLAAPVTEHFDEPSEAFAEPTEAHSAPAAERFADAPVEGAAYAERAEVAFVEPAESETGPEAVAPEADEPVAEYRPMAEFHHDYDDEEPEEDFALSIDAGDTPVVVEEAAAPTEEYFDENAPLYAGEPPVVSDRAADTPAMDFDEEDGRMVLASGPVDPSHDASDGEVHGGPLDDDDVYEQIRRKADEARARIARRLEQMKADEEAGRRGLVPGRIDLGAGAPPLAPRMSDEAEG